MARQSATVLHVNGPIILDWGNGIRLQLSPAGAVQPLPASPAVSTKGRAGRKPSPATVALISAMQADSAAGRPRSRAAYVQVLKAQGHKGSDASAGAIVAREAKRVFGKPLGRGKKGRKGPGRRGGGRQASPATAMLREKLKLDRAGEGLRDATYYTRWVVDQKGAGIGLKGARPIVYRELRQAKAA